MCVLLPIIRSYWSYGALVIISLLAWHFDVRAVANANAVRVQAAQFKQAQAAATAIAQAALQHEQAMYQTKATEAEGAYQVQLGDARHAADLYIAAHRVPAAVGLRAKAAGSDAGNALASAAGSGSEVPASMPADAVVVSAGDVQACTDGITYAIKARDYVLSIAAASAAPDASAGGGNAIR